MGNPFFGTERGHSIYYWRIDHCQARLPFGASPFSISLWGEDVLLNHHLNSIGIHQIPLNHHYVTIKSSLSQLISIFCWSSVPCWLVKPDVSCFFPTVSCWWSPESLPSTFRRTSLSSTFCFLLWDPSPRRKTSAKSAGKWFMTMIIPKSEDIGNIWYEYLVL